MNIRMIIGERRINLVSANILVAFAAIILPMSNSGAAQDFDAVKTPDTPLVLQAQGSFIQDGSVKTLDNGEHITVNQMYVRYMIPAGLTKTPIIMVHGGGLGGQSYETTPDGRMGWAEMFARDGYPVFAPDQVTRGRSGFDSSIIAQVREGKLPIASLPYTKRTTDETAWVLFRIGPKPGTAFSDTQFPIEFMGQFSKQGIPQIGIQPPENYSALAHLARKVRGAVLLGHSESGQYGIEAALKDPAFVKGIIMVEPSCERVDVQTRTFTPYSDHDVRKIASIPMLVVFGDHLEAPYMMGVTWQKGFDDCANLITRVNSAGGNAQILYPPDLGIRGNTHLLMLDKNSAKIADLIMAWINKNVH